MPSDNLAVSSVVVLQRHISNPNSNQLQRPTKERRKEKKRTHNLAKTPLKAAHPPLASANTIHSFRLAQLNASTPSSVPPPSLLLLLPPSSNGRSSSGALLLPVLLFISTDGCCCCFSFLVDDDDDADGFGALLLLRVSVVPLSLLLLLTALVFDLVDLKLLLLLGAGSSGRGLRGRRVGIVWLLVGGCETARGFLRAGPPAGGFADLPGVTMGVVVPGFRVGMMTNKSCLPRPIPSGRDGGRCLVVIAALKD